MPLERLARTSKRKNARKRLHPPACERHLPGQLPLAYLKAKFHSGWKWGFAVDAKVSIFTLDELRHWLDGKPRQWSQAIAVRAALRVLPLTFAYRVEDELRARLVLQSCRAAFVAWTIARYDQTALAAAAIAAATDAAAAPLAKPPTSPLTPTLTPPPLTPPTPPRRTPPTRPPLPLLPTTPPTPPTVLPPGRIGLLLVQMPPGCLKIMKHQPLSA